jgi:hypothetical protein
VNPNPVLHPIHPERVTGTMPANCGPSLAFQNHAFATNTLLVAAHDITGHFLEQLPNDGMATVESAKGLPGATFMGCLPADHLAEVGHFESTDQQAWSGFDHKIFYRFMASVLADAER